MTFLIKCTPSAIRRSSDCSNSRNVLVTFCATHCGQPTVARHPSNAAARNQSPADAAVAVAAVVVSQPRPPIIAAIIAVVSTVVVVARNRFMVRVRVTVTGRAVFKGRSDYGDNNYRVTITGPSASGSVVYRSVENDRFRRTWSSSARTRAQLSRRELKKENVIKIAYTKKRFTSSLRSESKNSTEIDRQKHRCYTVMMTRCQA